MISILISPVVLLSFGEAEAIDIFMRITALWDRVWTILLHAHAWALALLFFGSLAVVYNRLGMRRPCGRRNSRSKTGGQGRHCHSTPLSLHRRGRFGARLHGIVCSLGRWLRRLSPQLHPSAGCACRARFRPPRDSLTLSLQAIGKWGVLFCRSSLFRRSSRWFLHCGCPVSWLNAFRPASETKVCSDWASVWTATRKLQRRCRQTAVRPSPCVSAVLVLRWRRGTSCSAYSCVNSLVCSTRWRTGGTGFLQAGSAHQLCAGPAATTPNLSRANWSPRIITRD